MESNLYCISGVSGCQLAFLSLSSYACSPVYLWTYAAITLQATLRASTTYTPP